MGADHAEERSRTALVDEKRNVVISCGQSRRLLTAIGFAGEAVHTPGHSEHCVSLLLDDGSVFNEDLPPEPYAFDNPVALETWRLLREKGATRVYPAHGPIRAMMDTAQAARSEVKTE
jgi:glyoxylase-like metal-dependent hydrolase (beta-lactamase superfamily II)